MNWKLPNQLTMARLVLAGVFFALLGSYPVPTAGGARGAGPLLLDIAFGLYIVAGITDILDGYLARKWNLTSAFGRIVDPFVDKVLVVGAFAMLTGSNFVLVEGFHSEWERSLPTWLTGGMASCVQAWMVVVVLAREMIVSAVRGYSESQGREFPATVWGKAKMLTQSIAICTLLIGVSHVTQPRWAVVVKLLCVWISVIVTVLSGFAYVSKARKLLMETD
ncbi:MAG TPA: CDP-alcohol phosphatidyltransferase family protein [Phycisphaerae bacterium]|nr:CDP-alcohol phosphatidyltransferase family protein [Phycisphaerae bacterium]